MNNTYAEERNLIFTILQLVNRINEILTIEKYQTQLQTRAIQGLQRLQIYQVPHEMICQPTPPHSFNVEPCSLLCSTTLPAMRAFCCGLVGSN